MSDSWKKNYYAIWVAQLLAIAAFGSVNPILPFYIQELGVTELSEVKLWTGIIQSVGAAGVAVFAPIWGRLADSYGRRIMFLRALFAGSITMVLMGVATHPWQLVLFRGLGGIFTGTVAAATTLVATTVPRDKVGHTLGLLSAAVMVGSAAGPVLSGTIADLFGYRIAFFVSFLLFLVAGIIVLTLVRENFTRNPPQGSFWRAMIPDFSVLVRSKELMVLIILVAVIQLANSAIVPILPLFIQSLAPAAGMLGTTAGFIIGIRAFSGAVAAAAIGRVSDRLGFKRVLMVCLIGGVVTHLSLLIVNTPMQLLFMRLFAGLFLGGTIPSVNALIALKADEGSHGTIYGLSSSTSAAGFALGPALGASIAAVSGFPPVFLLIAGVLGAALIGAGLFVRKDRKHGAAADG